MTHETMDYFSADFDNASATIEETVKKQLNPSHNVIGYFDVSRIVDSVDQDEVIEPNVYADQYETQEQKLRRLTKFTGDVETLLAKAELPQPTSEDYDELLAVTHDLMRGDISPSEQLAEWLHNPKQFLSTILYQSRVIREGLDKAKQDDVHPSEGESMYFRTGESQATKVTWFNRYGGEPDLGERGKLKRSQWAKYKLFRQFVDNPLMRILSYDVDMSAPVGPVRGQGITINRDGKIYPIRADGFPLASNSDGNWALPFVKFGERSVFPLIDEGNRFANGAVASRGIGDITLAESIRSESAARSVDALRELTPGNLLLAMPLGRMITRNELAQILPEMTPESFVDIERATSGIARNYRPY